MTHEFRCTRRVVTGGGEVNDTFTPWCPCGWAGQYTHAAERFARDDWAFHVTRKQPEPGRLP